MDELLMKKNEQMRFLILKKIIWSKSGLSVDELMHCFEVSNTTIYRHVDQLKSDLAIAFSEYPVQILQNGRLLSIDYQEASLIYIIDYMHLYYLKTSQNFAIINAILTKVYPSIESLAQELHLSTSYTYKTIGSINMFLEKFNLKIKFNLANPRSNILGKEASIRLFLFFSQWMVFKGIDMPLGESPLKFKTAPSPIRHQLITSNQLAQLSHYQVITYFRIIVKKKKIHLPKPFIDYLMLIESVSPTNFPLEITKTIDRHLFSDADLKKEEAFFGFAIRFFVADVDSLETKKLISEKLMASSLPLAVFITDFLTAFSATFKLSFTDDEYLSIYYLLSIKMFYYQYLDIDISLLDPAKTMKTMLNTLELKELTSFTEKQLDSSLIKPDSKKVLVAHFSEVLYTILKSTQKKKLTIFVQYSRSIYLNDFIKTNLFKTFSAETITFTKLIEEADLVVSDIFEATKKQPQQIFYLENPYDLTTWHQLILFISDCLF